MLRHLSEHSYSWAALPVYSEGKVKRDLPVRAQVDVQGIARRAGQALWLKSLVRAGCKAKGSRTTERCKSIVSTYRTKETLGILDN